MSFADHFSAHAESYARARPTYPDALFDWLAGIAPARDDAWDCATGNGQAAAGLAARFRQVVATDGSRGQIASARGPANVTFSVALAESAPLADATFDLVTIAQAAHWLDLDRAWPEVRRVLRKGGVVAAWCYQRPSVAPAIDAVLAVLHDAVLAPHWPPGREHVDAGYRGLPFPFAERRDVPAFEMRTAMSLAAFEDYLRTWSSAQRHRAATGTDAVLDAHDAFAAAWGDGPREVRWPLGARGHGVTGHFT